MKEIKDFFMCITPLQRALIISNIVITILNMAIYLWGKV